MMVKEYNQLIVENGLFRDLSGDFDPMYLIEIINYNDIKKDLIKERKSKTIPITKLMWYEQAVKMPRLGLELDIEQLKIDYIIFKTWLKNSKNIFNQLVITYNSNLFFK